MALNGHRLLTQTLTVIEFLFDHSGERSFPYTTKEDDFIEAQPHYTICITSNLEEIRITSPCTFRVCNQSGSEILLEQLFNPNRSKDDRCSYDRRLARPPNAFASQEQVANTQVGGSFVMFPRSDFTENGGCEGWFHSLPKPSAGGLELIRRYISLRVPTSGISRTVFYSSRAGAVNGTTVIAGYGGADSRRYLVVYAAATVDSLRQRLTAFNLRRLRAALGANTFIIVADAAPSADDGSLADLADVVLRADFVSPDTFFDGATLQEGVLEAYRLFGVGLLGFYGLLVINDSVLGPIAADLADVLPRHPVGDPIMVALSVWAGTVVSGTGLLINRAGFKAAGFSDFWRYMRFPCGKWGSMALWEGPLHAYMVGVAGLRCYTFTNDVTTLNAAPSSWDSGGPPFFKHKNSGDQQAVLRYLESHDPAVLPTRPGPVPEPCSM